MAFKVLLPEKLDLPDRQGYNNLQAQALAAALRPRERGHGKPTTRLYPGGAQPKSSSQASCFKCGLKGHVARCCLRLLRGYALSASNLDTGNHNHPVQACPLCHAMEVQSQPHCQVKLCQPSNFSALQRIDTAQTWFTL